MCGIFGIIGNTKNLNIEECLNSIKHRGPDDEGKFKDENIILGFRRLSIIDLSSCGHQPMTNENSDIWIVFNGEIYNYLQLRDELLPNHRFISKTDTEVLIHGYEQWGVNKLLSKLNGMFAFCLYDKKKKIIYMVRDRIGKKPLYYYKANDYIAFASEVKAFFHLSSFKFIIDEEMFSLWMGFPYLPDNEKTIIRDVYKVPPASYLKISLGKQKEIKQYWHLPQENKKVAFSTAKNELEKLLIDSVIKRLVADVPVGILLSGGLDSSLIAALASKYSNTKINTINISFENSLIDESKYANIVATHCHTNHTNLSLKLTDIYNEFKSHIKIYDDLSTTDSGLFSEYLLAKKIREIGVKVVLVGEGADEIFAGYSWFQLSNFPLNLLPEKIKFWLYHYAIMRTLPNQKSFFYVDFMKKKMQETDMSFLKKIQYFEIKYSLPNHYCMKVDKGTSAASVEARAPYMDYRIAELASQIPDKYLLNSSIYNPTASNEKYILRQIAQKYLPKIIYERKKKGGMMPVYDILNIGIKQDKQLILNNKYLNNFLGKSYILDIINSHPKNKFLQWHREWLLWKALVFSLWYTHYQTDPYE